MCVIIILLEASATEVFFVALFIFATILMFNVIKHARFALLPIIISLLFMSGISYAFAHEDTDSLDTEKSERGLKKGDKSAALLERLAKFEKRLDAMQDEIMKIRMGVKEIRSVLGAGTGSSTKPIKVEECKEPKKEKVATSSEMKRPMMPIGPKPCEKTGSSTVPFKMDKPKFKNNEGNVLGESTTRQPIDLTNQINALQAQIKLQTQKDSNAILQAQIDALMKRIAASNTNQQPPELTNSIQILQQQIRLKTEIDALTKRIAELTNTRAELQKKLDALSIPTPTPTPTPTSAYIEVGSDDATATFVENDPATTLDDTGRYTVSFEVTAMDGAAYIPLTAKQGGSPLSAGVVFVVQDEQGITVTTGKVISTLTSQAPMVEKNMYYLVEEGNSEDFTLTVEYTPAMAGKYQIHLQNVNWNTKPAAPSISVITDPVEEFTTDELKFKNVVTPTPTPTPTPVAKFGTAIGVGAYEGTYPKGVTHSGGNHPQGTVTVYIPDAGTGWGKKSMVLVLTSYEPVKWNITGPGVKHIGRVLATGYYKQEVAGLDASIPVDKLSYENKDKNYFFAYQTADAQYTSLKTYVVKQYGVDIQQFIGNYVQKEAKFTGFKG